MLWNILRKNGITGNFLNIIKSIYDNVLSIVKCANGATEFFTCPNGLKQGCILNHMLFSLLVQEITNEIRSRGGYGIQLTPDIVELSILLFADAIVLIADTVFKLQKKLDVLYEVATKLGLIVNIDKSKVLVFRKGGRLASIEKWHVGGKRLEVVTEYNYLGFLFSNKLNTNAMLKQVSSKANTVFCRITRLSNNFNNMSFTVLCKIFDAQIQPILLYGSKLWGLDDISIIESIHIFSLKKIPNVPLFTPNIMVYGDTDRYELRINSVIR